MQHAAIIERKIDELRPRFLAMLSARLDRFEQIRDALATSDDPTPLLDELRVGTHRIVGLAATLGFADLGRLAQFVELTILRMSESPPSDQNCADLFDALDVLLGEMALLAP